MKRRATLRRKIKHHIKKRGDNHDFEMTDSFCLYWWHHLNESVFNDQLTPPIRFERRAFRDCAGWCKQYASNRKDYYRVVIGLSTQIYDRKTFLTTLCHEMVHQWEWEVLNMWDNSEHGKEFFSWRPKIQQRVNLPLAISIEF